jgi:hypothetical protein
MRLLFFILLLANLVVLLALQSARTVGTEPARIAGQLHPERLTLIDEPAPGATATQPSAPASAAMTASSACVDVGDFSSRSAEDFETRLAQLSPGVLPKKRQVQAPPQHIVFLPPQAGQAAAGRRLAQLREMGFADSAIIRDEPTRRWGISLGLFSRVELAEARQQTLRAAGISDARVGEYPVNSARYAYRLAGLDEATTRRLGELASSLAGVALRSCQ